MPHFETIWGPSGLAGWGTVTIKPVSLSLHLCSVTMAEETKSVKTPKEAEAMPAGPASPHRPGATLSSSDPVVI